MGKISNYLIISPAAKSIKELYTRPEDFRQKYGMLETIEKEAYVRHLLVNNVPYAFKEAPLLYEQLTQYLADALQIQSSEIKLIGSAKTGFSISPPPSFGKTFSHQSDLDFSIANETLFNIMAQEFSDWAQLFTSNQLVPITDSQRKFWPQNLHVCSRTLRRGFIDANKIPAMDQFPRTKRVYECMYQIKDKLMKVHRISVIKSTTRIYKNWHSFIKQLMINTESVMNKQAGN